MSDPTTDRERGLYRGRPVARVLTSPDGLTILVGKSAADNDILSLKLGRPFDFWLHVAGESGSHVVVLNPEKLSRLPRETARMATALAARYSKARAGGQVAIHLATCGDLSKPRGAAAGKVALRRYETVYGRPDEAPEG
ncbi:MAG TPA: NFACT RNA binding domain-containing protein [Thermoanaerobaculia bacterium]|nr:NFACT RNA binding domain-containing protein [Thermoanaerobaculia bacterium]